MKKILLLNTLFLLAILSTTAQVVYTDINPDVTTTLNTNPGYVDNVVSIDFNGDGTEEYNFRWDDYGASGWFMHMTYANGNVFNLKGTATNPYGGRYLDPMNLGDAINSSANWGTSSPEPFIGDNSDPNFKGLGDKYVGVKFLLNGDTYYGWVLVSFDNNRTLTVKSYAYQSTKNTPINAGEGINISTNTSVKGNKISIYPNPSNNFISIDNIENISNITINDVCGKSVLKEKSISQKSLKIDVSKLHKGIYFINLFNENKLIETKKLIIN